MIQSSDETTDITIDENLILLKLHYQKLPYKHVIYFVCIHNVINGLLNFNVETCFSVFPVDTDKFH